MDEIIIEEKKYISSKQASKITGYAKDYIGQLCREGRVPARLVGRSWYVLESAIQDHRFGNQEIDMGKVTPEPVKPVPAERGWGSFHYEAQADEVVPSVYGEHVEPVYGEPVEPINQLQEKSPVEFEPSEDKHDEIVPEVSQSLHEAWSEWFDSVKNAAPPVEAPQALDTSAAAEPEINEEAKEESVNIPLTIVNYQDALEREPMSVQQKPEEKPAQALQEQPRKTNSNGVMLLVQLCAGALIIISVVLTIAGIGFLDKYLASSNTLQMLSGSIVYER